MYTYTHLKAHFCNIILLLVFIGDVPNLYYKTFLHILVTTAWV